MLCILCLTLTNIHRYHFSPVRAGPGSLGWANEIWYKLNIKYIFCCPGASPAQSALSRLLQGMVRTFVELNLGMIHLTLLLSGMLCCTLSMYNNLLSVCKWFGIWAAYWNTLHLIDFLTCRNMRLAEFKQSRSRASHTSSLWRRAARPAFTPHLIRIFSPFSGTTWGNCREDLSHCPRICLATH